MAPPTGATGKPGQGGPRRPASAAHKPVVPVIPLPYLQRQRRAPPAAISAQPTAHGQPARDRPANKHEEAETRPRQGADEVEEAQKPAVDHYHTVAAGRPQSQTQTAEGGAVTPSATPSEAATTPANDPLATPPSPPSSKKELKEADTPLVRTSATYVTEPAASPTPTRRRAGPAFQAFTSPQYSRPMEASTGPFHSTGINHGHISSMTQERSHQPHLSNGSLVVGGLYDSNASSPVPVTSGAAQPPNTMSYPSEGVAPSGVDGYGRPFLVSPAFDGFPPQVFHLPPHHPGPPTPHSFHGSQSSAHADENGFSAYPTANGPNRYPVHSASQAQRNIAAMSLDPQSGVRFSLAAGPAPGCTISRSQAQALDFLRAGIERPEFPDCTLEVRLVNSHQPRAIPLIIPCHRFIISRSPMLNHLLRTRDTPAGGHLVLDLQDDYVRSDAFHLTLRTLYGWDLGDGPLHPYHPQQSVKDGFELALGYAASAQHLKLPFVYAKAIHHACHQLHWDTIERACQFALPSAVFGQSARHGNPSSPDALVPSHLIDAIMVFLVHNITEDFVLDPNAGDCGFSRLPRASAPVASSQAMPAKAHGTAGFRDERPQSRHASTSQTHMPRASRLSVNPRLSSIQFGDLSLANGSDKSSGGQVDAVKPPSPSHVDTILSRILLNLPFPMLKQVLEHPNLAKPSADLSLPSRQKLISSIVAEREARRVSTLNKGDAQLRVFMENLENAVEPLVVQHMGDFMVNSMGFKEEVFPGDVPYLVQTWIHGSGSVSA